MVVKKIDGTRYIVEISSSEISEINAIISDLSLGDLTGYDDANNKMLFDKLMARRVAAEIYRRDIKFPDTGFIVVDTNIDGRNISYSIGNVVLNNTTYKISDVIYV